MIFIIQLFIFHSLAQWEFTNEKSFEVPYKHSLEDPAITTLWGGFRRALNWRNFQGELYSHKPVHMKNSLEFYLRKVQNKAPLVIFVPGIYGDYDGKVSPQIITTIESTNTHLLVIPNNLSPKYIKANPQYKDNLYQQDIEIAFDIMNKAIELIGKENVTEISLLGESLGSFVASGLYSFDANKDKLIDANLMLLWPPLNLKKSVQLIDKKINLYRNKYQQCSTLWFVPQALYYFYWNESPIVASKDFVQCSQAFLYNGFFLEATKSVSKSYASIVQQATNREVKSIEDFFSIFRPKLTKLIQSDHEVLNLSFWINQAFKKNPISLKVISSLNDPINDYRDWNHFKTKSGLSNKNLLLLDWGAHCAPMSLKRWDKMMLKELGLQ